MGFFILPRGAKTPDSGRGDVYLKIDHWNDFSFVTMFFMSLHDEMGRYHDIGLVKIGFRDQTTDVPTYKKAPSNFIALGEEFFSLGQDADFYKKVAALGDFGKSVLLSLRDLVLSPGIIDDVRDEKVLKISLLRDISLSVMKGQFARILEGRPQLTDFKFRFSRPETEDLGAIDLSFDVNMGSIPSTNIHAIIGRNGVGKTTLLNGMIEAITSENSSAKFLNVGWWQEEEISKDYFSSLVSVSFSAFDPFTPPAEQPDPSRGTCYFYIGLKDSANPEYHRNIGELRIDCVKALIACFYNLEKRNRWLRAINKLGSDENFASMGLERLQLVYETTCQDLGERVQPDSDEFLAEYTNRIQKFLSRMSSGHAIVFLTITRLVSKVEEKTLVLLDEPESHLHPPLLSAFIRAISDLLNDRNGVAIIATHSPVVLQEIPKSCVRKIYRTGASITSSWPSVETFGENVGLLTSEVFSLEVERSGFHDLLADSVRGGGAYSEIVASYNNQLGLEGRSILKALVENRDRGHSHDEIA